MMSKDNSPTILVDRTGDWIQEIAADVSVCGTVNACSRDRFALKSNMPASNKGHTLFGLKVDEIFVLHATEYYDVRFDNV